MIRITNIKGTLEEPPESIKNKALKLLGLSEAEQIRISKKAVDARNKNQVHYVYSVDVKTEREDRLFKEKGGGAIKRIEEYEYRFPAGRKPDRPPVIVGTGPAGLFAGLVLAQNGYAPVLLERGKEVQARRQAVERFWNGGNLEENTNVQFGEGGAGTFSDGKLTTGIKDPRIQKVLTEFTAFGAPEEILYLSKPHIGTDRLQDVVKGLRKEIIRLGGQVRFEHRMTDLLVEKGQIKGVCVQTPEVSYEIQAEQVILAAGHSARDTFAILRDRGVQMEQKPFSLGARIEHAQKMISESQYGKFYSQLPAADYKLAVHLPGGRSVYTFCMCPGGYVVNAASEPGRIVTNGMSNFSRNGENANSALLVSVTPEDFGGADVLAGITMQREIEARAFAAGGSTYRAPAQLVGDFLKGRASTGVGNIQPAFLPGVVMGEITGVLPGFVTEAMGEGLRLMDKRLKGFACPEAVLTAPETRSSSPVRILRDRETLQTSLKGLFSAGEGGGHAGGITSAAVDGIKCAEALAQSLKG